MNRTTTTLLLFSALVMSAPISLTAAPISIDTVPVGDLGNANDPATGNLYGGVGYAYNIGGTEVTVGQYTAFLNAVAATDTYALYNTSMATNLNIAGIARSGASGSYTYSVIGSQDKPVTYVSWGDAARFSNWLHNNQPTGLQIAGTTETGAYTLNGATSDAALNAVSRNSGATWFIPTESEWYKSAYYQPAAQGGDTDDYWLYPTGTNSTTYSDQPPGSGAPTQSNTGNFYANDFVANGYNDGYAVTGSTSFPSGNALTDAGAYTLSASPYGTFDQGGNVGEWNEALIGGLFRGSRGGSWVDSSSFLQSSLGSSNSPTGEVSGLGFRVATVPEPSTLALSLFVVAGLAALAIRKQRVR